MKFWKVFFSGKKDETVSADCGGSYTVSANDEEQAQEEAASMAHQDGVTEVSIESCAPLQNEEAWTSEGFTSATDYTPFCSTSSYVVLPNETCSDATTLDGYVAYTTISTTAGLHYDEVYLRDDDDDEWDDEWDEDDYSPPYVSYTFLTQQTDATEQSVDQTCTANTLSGYTAYNGYTSATKVSASPNNDDKLPKAYQEPWANGYYNYKMTNRISLTQGQKIKVRGLV